MTATSQDQTRAVSFDAAGSASAAPSDEAVPGVMEVEPAARPLKIAILYSRMPLPMDRADQMTVAHLVAFLSARGHKVDLWTLDNGEATSDRQRQWLEAHCHRFQAFPHSLLNRLGGTCLGLLKGLPLQCGWFANAAQREAVRAACEQESYDVVYTYLIRSAEIVRGFLPPQGPGPVTYLAMQVSQALNTRRIFERSSRWRDKLIYGLEYRLTRRYEARIWEDFSRAVLIGPQDVDEVKEVCRESGRRPIDNFDFGPHGVDLRKFTPRGEDEAEPATAVFSGSLRTNTNIEAITWFVNLVWPSVIRARPDAKLLIVGRSPTAGVRRLERQAGVEVIGEVPEMAPYLGRAAVCVNPVRACAGQQNKLLEYMAMAKAIVATSFANEGIGGAAGRDLEIADDPEAFADLVLKLFEDQDRRKELGAAARAFVAANWSWEALYLQLEASFCDTLDGRSPPQTGG
ncbi:MAG: glycosyltransferase [Geminicoccaceae bacterium]